MKDMADHSLLAGNGNVDSLPHRADLGGERPDLRQIGGAVALALGFVAIAVGWWGSSGTLSSDDQFAYLISGGIGGGALVALGLAALVSWEHSQDRAAIGVLLRRLDAIERELAEDRAATRELVDRLGGAADDAPSPRRRRSSAEA